MHTPVAGVDPGTLLDLEAPPVSLADKFGAPPLSVLDRRAGWWRTRRRQWLSLGIESEIGRSTTSGATSSLAAGNRKDFMARAVRGEDGDMGQLVASGVSVFDPVLCELVYRWYSRPGDHVLDPFAGGSVRGVVASTLGRQYTGVDIRPEQVTANQTQIRLGSSLAPEWVLGDATELAEAVAPHYEADLVFSCPPYADLEVYSDDPADLSTLPYDRFVLAHASAISQACARLAADRFFVWVISDIRDRRGDYRGLVRAAADAMSKAGLHIHSDLILLDQVGHAALRAERTFRATRRVPRVHQHVLVGVMGDARRATARLEQSP